MPSIDTACSRLFVNNLITRVEHDLLLAVHKNSHRFGDRPFCNLSAARLASMIQYSHIQVKRCLKSLVEKGYLIRCGSYEVSVKYQQRNFTGTTRIQCHKLNYGTVQSFMRCIMDDTRCISSKEETLPLRGGRREKETVRPNVNSAEEPEAPQRVRIGTKTPTNNSDNIPEANTAIPPTRSRAAPSTSVNTTTTPSNESNILTISQKEEFRMSGFMNTPERKNPVLQTSVQQINTDRAKRLHSILVRTRRISAKYNRQKWGKEMELLAEQTDGADIDKVIDWLGKVGNAEFVTTVLSAKSFREKFDRLRESMNSHRKEEIALNVSKGSEDIAGELETYYDGINRKETPYVAQTCIDRAAELLTRFRAARDAHKPGSRVYDAADHLLAFFKTPTRMARWWLVEVTQRYFFGRDTPRKLRRFGLRQDHPLFEELMEKVLSEFGGTTLWDALKGAVNEIP